MKPMFPTGNYCEIPSVPLPDPIPCPPPPLGELLCLPYFIFNFCLALTLLLCARFCSKCFPKRPHLTLPTTPRGGEHYCLQPTDAERGPQGTITEAHRQFVHGAARI